MFLLITDLEILPLQPPHRVVEYHRSNLLLILNYSCKFVQRKVKEHNSGQSVEGKIEFVLTDDNIHMLEEGQGGHEDQWDAYEVDDLVTKL